MKRLYPQVSSFEQGHLDTIDGHRLYYELSGNPQGIPVLFIHGGPGAGLPPNYTCFFDTNRYFIIAFEQRGCGRSTPFASLENNTTAHTLADIERLRTHFSIDQWVLFGGSWGATLALLAAIQAPQHVLGVILRGTFLGRQEDRDWFLTEKGCAAALFPEQFAFFTAGINGPLTSEGICAHYYAMFTNGCEVKRAAAIKRWYLWEERLSRLVLPHGTGDITAHYPLPLMTSLATLECHYLMNHCYIEENFILDNISKVTHIPCTIVHGRYDMICKTAAAYELNEAWENSELQIVADAGHSTSEAGIALALCRASRDMSRFIRERKS